MAQATPSTATRMWEPSRWLDRARRSLKLRYHPLERTRQTLQVIHRVLRPNRRKNLNVVDGYGRQLEPIDPEGTRFPVRPSRAGSDSGVLPGARTPDGGAR